MKELPTLFFSNQDGLQLELNGYQPYERFEKILKQLHPGIKKSKYNKSADFLFNQFHSMTSKELSFLTDEKEKETSFVLQDLLAQKKIKQLESPSGSMWISNFVPVAAEKTA